MNMVAHDGTLAGTVKTNSERIDYIRANGQVIAAIKVKHEGANGWVTTPTYYHNDHLGSAQTGTNASGVATFQEYYTPFGEVENASPHNADKAGFTGHIRDAATGLTYMQARYQHPVTGRFLSVDPVTFMDTGKTGYVNRYVYAMNDPVNNIDPTGMACITADNTTTCNSPGDAIGEYTVPPSVVEQANGMPDIGPQFPFYHAYTGEETASITSNTFVNALVDEITNDPTPGKDSAATADGTINDAGVPVLGLMPMTDNVVSFTATDSNGNPVIANITVGGEHVLGPAGIVSQGIRVENGQTIVTFVGEGHALMSIPTQGQARRTFSRKIRGDIRAATNTAVRAGDW